MSERVLLGQNVECEADFHKAMRDLFDLGGHYGDNLDALWDRLSADIERPIVLVWKDAARSRAHLGRLFEQIIGVLERVKKQDEEWKLDDRFDYRLE